MVRQRQFFIKYASHLKRHSCHHIETSQLICRINHLTGFYMMTTLAFYKLKDSVNWLIKQVRLDRCKGFSSRFHEIQITDHCAKNAKIWRFFWSVFSRIRTKYGYLLHKSPHLVRIRENTDQKKLRFLTFLVQWIYSEVCHTSLMEYL